METKEYGWPLVGGFGAITSRSCRTNRRWRHSSTSTTACGPCRLSFVGFAPELICSACCFTLKWSTLPTRSATSMPPMRVPVVLSAAVLSGDEPRRPTARGRSSRFAISRRARKPTTAHPAPEAVLLGNESGHGDVGKAACFPYFYAPDGCGQMSKSELH